MALGLRFADYLSFGRGGITKTFDFYLQAIAPSKPNPTNSSDRAS
ncbi:MULTISPECIES: hypothetical protein [unclassified Nostoc]|nr:hypothetical protein [Nostoc sp. S13]MDF5739817.1 hypothetical protein [Nostoc sp. S13]